MPQDSPLAQPLSETGGLGVHNVAVHRDTFTGGRSIHRDTLNIEKHMTPKETSVKPLKQRTLNRVKQSTLKHMKHPKANPSLKPVKPSMFTGTPSSST